MKRSHEKEQESETHSIAHSGIPQKHSSGNYNTYSEDVTLIHEGFGYPVLVAVSSYVL